MLQCTTPSDGMFIPRLMFAAPGSGHGKTTIMAGVAQSLRERGMKVATFKAGPDYLDPTYHEHASGRKCINLDQWLMGRDGVCRAFARGVGGCDIALIEGVMGLYDGLDPSSQEGSSWELAKILACPVLLVVDAGGMARSLAAMVKGFKEFDKDQAEHSRLCAVIVNRMGSLNHGNLLRRALGDVNEIEYLGGMIAQKQTIFDERHLGLVSLRQNPNRKDQLAVASRLVQDGIDLDRLVSLARSAPLFYSGMGAHNLTGPSEKLSSRPFPDRKTMGLTGKEKPRCRIGVARDAAFDFYYEENLELLESFGAEIIPFSPIHDRLLLRCPEGFYGIDALYFGGGYPELYARELAENTTMIADIRKFGQLGGLIYGECGGYMYLCQSLHPSPSDPEISWNMVGLLPGKIIMHDRLKAIGYAEVETQVHTPLGPAGLRFRGHQFRYSERQSENPDPVVPYRIRKRRDPLPQGEGSLVGNVLGSYVHAHWGSNPLVPQSLIKQCLASPIRTLGRVEVTT